VRPNPTSQRLYLEPGAPVAEPAVMLFGMDGRVAISRRRVQQELDLSGLAPGVYTLLYFDGERLLSRQQVVVH
jgi:hypothetical protein